MIWVVLALLYVALLLYRVGYERGCRDAGARMNQLEAEVARLRKVLFP